MNGEYEKKTITVFLLSEKSTSLYISPDTTEAHPNTGKEALEPTIMKPNSLCHVTNRLSCFIVSTAIMMTGESVVKGETARERGNLLRRLYTGKMTLMSLYTRIHTIDSHFLWCNNYCTSLSLSQPARPISREKKEFLFSFLSLSLSLSSVNGSRVSFAWTSSHCLGVLIQARGLFMSN